MNRTTSTTIAALLVAAVAAGAAMPALAQDRGTGPRDNFAVRGEGGPGMHREIQVHRGAGGPGGGFLALNCGPNAGDRLEHMLLNVEQRTDPTAEQTALYEAFKSAAIAAQSEFAASCPTPPAEGDTAERDLVERMTTRLAVEEARLAALSSVLPAFEAFYTSLSDDQKAALEPRGDHGGDGRRHGFRMHRGPGATGGEAAPVAPAEPAPLNG